MIVQVNDFQVKSEWIITRIGIALQVYWYCKWSIDVNLQSGGSCLQANKGLQILTVHIRWKYRWTYLHCYTVFVLIWTLLVWENVLLCLNVKLPWLKAV